jgi:hypothetical protein
LSVSVEFVEQSINKLSKFAVHSATTFVDGSSFDRILKVPRRMKISVVLDTATRGLMNWYVSKQLGACLQGGTLERNKLRLLNVVFS